MPELSKKMDRFTAAILAEATAETERVMAEVREKRKAAFDEAEDQVLVEAYHYIRGEVARIKAEAGRQVSRHMLENKRALYLRREAISREVFAQVEGRIAAFTATPDYVRRLGALLRQALEILSGAEDVVVYLRPQDMAHAAAFKAAAGEISIDVAQGEFNLGGIIVESAGLGRQVDASFDSAMGELSGHFAEQFGLALDG